MHQVSVGEKYSGPVPQQDGLHFEIGPDGDMQLLIQFQRPSREEREALLAGFRQYSLYRHQGDIVLACWVFKFAAPVSYMDAPFYAGLYRGSSDNRVERFMSRMCDEEKANILTVIMLDGDIVQGLRIVGLHQKAVDQFYEIFMEQFAPIDRQTYNRAIDEMYHLDSKELFNRGLQFSHRETKQ